MSESDRQVWPIVFSSCSPRVLKVLGRARKIRV